MAIRELCTRIQFGLNGFISKLRKLVESKRQITGFHTRNGVQADEGKEGNEANEDTFTISHTLT